MDAKKLIRVNLELENHIDENGDLIPFEGNRDCLLYIAKYENGHIIYFNKNIPTSIRKKIKKIDPEILAKDTEIAKEIFSDFVPLKKITTYISCYFTHTPSSNEFPNVIQEMKAFVIKRDNKIVSSAWAQEENESAIELAVETIPEYQRRGYGKQVVAACANDAITKGKIAFYSYEIGNIESAALAKNLEVVQYAVCTSFSSI